MNLPASLHLFLAITILPFSPTIKAAVLRVPAAAGSRPLSVWVHFKDKEERGAFGQTVSSGALARRRAAAFTRNDEREDWPVSSRYIRDVASIGGVLRRSFKWGNAASFIIPAERVALVRSLTCVRDVTLVGNFRSKIPPRPGVFLRKTSDEDGRYGTLHRQLSMMNIPAAHAYIGSVKGGAAPGAGVRIALFDSGFRLDHRCFRHLVERGAVKAVHDFIDDDGSVNDPDSVSGSASHPYWSNDVHGTQALSIIAAYDPPHYLGCAWGADFCLARTEDTYFDTLTYEERESHVEEDNWAEAVVWAESLGVDIISSSLGYSTGFQDTVVIEREGGALDTIVDYSKGDLDGKTTIVSRAARGAIERGILIVNAAGNEQDWGDTSLSAPADVEGVVAVGAVNDQGRLTPFSSLGPGADPRLQPKPDLVAPGASIPLPDIQNPDKDAYGVIGSGTSFAAPFVSGACALVRQMHGAEAGETREKLYASCRLLPFQRDIDNSYGRGMPNVLRSIMPHADEFLVRVKGKAGSVVSGADIVTPEGDRLGRTGDDGLAHFRLGTPAPDTLEVISDGEIRRTPIDPSWGWLELMPCSLLIRVTDSAGRSLPSVRVDYQRIQGGPWITLKGDSLIVIEEFAPAEIRLTAEAPHHQRSDTIRTALGETAVEHVIRLPFGGGPFFEMYPSVFSRNRDSRLTMNFFESSTRSGESLTTVSIRAIDGTLVWRADTLSQARPLTFRWNGKRRNGRSPAPGTYFVMLTRNGKKYRRKFIIAE